MTAEVFAAFSHLGNPLKPDLHGFDGFIRKETCPSAGKQTPELDVLCEVYCNWAVVVSSGSMANSATRRRP